LVIPRLKSNLSSATACYEIHFHCRASGLTQRRPQDTQSRIFLAEIYLDQDRNSLAIQQLQLVLKQEPDPDWLPETIENKKIASTMLEHIQKH
jgi:hypothetical protein